MRMRNMTLADYGISNEDGEKLYKHCLSLDEEERRKLHEAAKESCGGDVLATVIVESLTTGKGFSALSADDYIPVGKDDFYGYRRKTLKKFADLLKTAGEKSDG